MDKKTEILSAYEFRHACKEFDPDKKISDEDFAFILETGRLSPSSFGWEPWKFLVVQNMDIREKLKPFAWGAQKQLPTASHFVLIMARKAIDTKPGSVYLDYISREIQHLPENVVEMKTNAYKNFVEKDFDLTDDRKLFDWACKQTYIPLGNMMTAAAQIGIDSCPIEGFDRAKIDGILKEEGIIDTDHFSVSVLVAFGYRTKDAQIFDKTRQPIDKVVQWVE
ncbi:NAD(P)H-dependent oxidoreductase [Fervidibacillus albus]|uniref:NAD(P)H-dependent oxidoreductase n=1 Tax=Fervidibacillus albus TaxID=2980026 RepID=A0A9E8RUZ2_9BACI|nr:NAD(P)H-dependent oxidoreductase [Fervidibacillus albus]WAA08881.1 NAD(P)H-dependent oxidoreductase [Fervidibacillus albus]